MTTPDAKQAVRDALRPLAPRFGLRAVWVFGSQATGASTPRSDADVAVMVERPLELDTRLELADALSSALSHRVDLVDLERSSPILMRQVLRDGVLVLVLDRDPSRRLMFECTVPSRYADLRRFRRRSEEALAEALHD